MKIKITNNSKNVIDAKNDAIMRALRDAAYAILGDANNLVPHDTGELENSGDIELDKYKQEATIFFDKKYAISQHEDLSLRHPNGRRAKYLETPMKERGEEIQQWLASEINKEIVS